MTLEPYGTPFHSSPSTIPMMVFTAELSVFSVWLWPQWGQAYLLYSLLGPPGEFNNCVEWMQWGPQWAKNRMPYVIRSYLGGAVFSEIRSEQWQECTWVFLSRVLESGWEKGNSVLGSRYVYGSLWFSFLKARFSWEIPVADCLLEHRWWWVQELCGWKGEKKRPMREQARHPNLLPQAFK